MPANPLRGEVAIRLAAGEYILRPTFDALCRIETELDRPLLFLAGDLARGEIGARQTAVIVWRCGQAVPGNPALGIAQVGRQVTQLGLRDTGRDMLLLLSRALTVDDPEADRAESGGDSPSDGRLPWARFMETAGAMRWTPAQFWASTPREFFYFVRGFIASRGGGKTGQGARRPGGVGSRAEFLADFEDMKRRFPDGG